MILGWIRSDAQKIKLKTANPMCFNSRWKQVSTETAHNIRFNKKALHTHSWG